MIEMSLILPILILMLLGVVDFGLILQQAMVVQDSARTGAAYAIPYANATNTAGMVAAATQSAGAIPGYSAAATNTCACAPGASAISCSSSCPNNAHPAEYAQVTASANLPLLFGVQGFPASIPITFTARTRTAWPGPN